MPGKPIAIYLAIIVPAMFALSSAVGHWEPFLGAAFCVPMFGAFWLIARWVGGDE